MNNSLKYLIRYIIEHYSTFAIKLICLLSLVCFELQDHTYDPKIKNTDV